MSLTALKKIYSIFEGVLCKLFIGDKITIFIITCTKKVLLVNFFFINYPCTLKLHGVRKSFCVIQFGKVSGTTLILYSN